MIRGLNMEKGLENTGGDLNFYKSLLQDFFETYSNHTEKILRFVSQGDYKNAELEAHSLKGTSQMLGFEKIYDVALKMELSLREKDNEKFECLVHPLRNELNALLYDFKSSDLFQQNNELHLSLKLSEQEKSTLLERLDALLPIVKAGRYQAEVIVVKLLKKYADFGLKKKLTELKSLIEQLEFKEALGLIKTIQKEL
ncbi:MAG: Hpt domain-containing protein [Thermotogota bacterium]|nr:Hpt domain-containing protein [Thermotogota bacterium]